MPALSTPTLFITTVPDRTQPLNSAETVQLKRAYQDWQESTCYLDNNGNYRRKDGGKNITPWNKLVKSLFADNSDFHRAAEYHANTEVVFDPTQAPRFLSIGPAGQCFLAVEGKKSPVKIAECIPPGSDEGKRQTHAIHLADMLADALVVYGKTPHGRKAIQDFLERTGVE